MRELSTDEKIQGIRKHIIWAAKERELVEAIGNNIFGMTLLLNSILKIWRKK